MVFIVRRVSSLRILKMVAGMQCQFHQLLVGKKRTQNKLHFRSKVNKRLTSGQLMNIRFDRNSAYGTATEAICGLSQCHVFFMEQPEFFPNVPPFQNGHIYTQFFYLYYIPIFLSIILQWLLAGIFYASEELPNIFFEVYLFWNSMD